VNGKSYLNSMFSPDASCNNGIIRINTQVTKFH
jgi:hypothetical protein